MSVDVSHRAQRAPVPPTPERLHARAMRYLERFATTGAHLRRVLLGGRRGTPPPWNSTRPPCAPTWTPWWRGWWQQGWSTTGCSPRPAPRLNKSGRSPAQIGAPGQGPGRAHGRGGVARPGTGAGRSGAAAAMAYARRRLGPWRATDQRPAHRAKDLAALARTGFGYRVAGLVVAADDPRTSIRTSA